MAAGLAAFVQGYFGARDRQMAIADKKADRERQKKLDELVFSREARAAELHDLQVGETRRAISERDRDREIARSGAAAAQAAMEADQAAAAASGSTARAPDPVTGVAAELGLPLGAITNRAADTFVANNPLPGSAPSTPAVARSGPAAAAASRLPMGAVRGGGPGGGSPTGSGDAIIPQDATLQEWGPGPTGRINPDLYEMGAIGRRYSGGTPGPVRTDVASGPDTRSAGQWASDAAAPIRQGIVDALNGTAGITVAPRQAGLSVLQKGAGYAAGFAGFPETADKLIGAGQDSMDSAISNLTGMGQPSRKASGQANASPTAPGAEPSAPVNAGPRVSSLSPEGQKAEKQAREALGAARVIEQTASPETQGAAQAAMEAAATPVPGKGGKGLRPGEAVTPAQKERASKAFSDYYRESAVPVIIEAYLKEGEIEKAMRFQAFMDSETTKAGMRDWGQAVFALTTGDLDGFVENLSDSYNRNSYINDSTIVLKDQSEIFRDSQGNVTGARVVFKDESSGNTFDQVFSSQDDLIAFGMLNFAPEVVFENYVARAEAAKGNAKGVLDTRKTEAEIAKLEADAAKAAAEAESTRALSGLGSVAGVSGGVPAPMYRP